MNFRVVMAMTCILLFTLLALVFNGQDATKLAIGVPFQNAQTSAVESKDAHALPAMTASSDQDSPVLKARLHHADRVTSVAFSPNGLVLASGSTDSTVKMWDAVTGLEKRSLKHENAVTSVAFSPDGKTLASGGADPMITLWDVESGGQRRILTAHSHGIESLAYAPDGQTLVSAGDGTDTDKKILLWNPSTGELKGTLRGHSGKVTAFAFSSDGRNLVSASEDKTLILWDTMTGMAKLTFRGHKFGITSVAFSPDGKTAASASYYRGHSSKYRGVQLWDVLTAAFKSALGTEENSIHSIAFSPDGKIIAGGERSFGWINLFATRLDEDELCTKRTDLHTGKDYYPAGCETLDTLDGHDGSIVSLSFSPDGRTLASGSWDKTVILWDMAKEMEELRRLGRFKPQ